MSSSSKELLTGKRTKFGNDPWDEILQILEKYEEGVNPRPWNSLEEGGHDEQ